MTVKRDTQPPGKHSTGSAQPVGCQMAHCHKIQDCPVFLPHNPTFKTKIPISIGYSYKISVIIVKYTPTHADFYYAGLSTPVYVGRIDLPDHRFSADSKITLGRSKDVKHPTIQIGTGEHPLPGTTLGGKNRALLVASLHKIPPSKTFGLVSYMNFHISAGHQDAILILHLDLFVENPFGIIITDSSRKFSILEIGFVGVVNIMNGIDSPWQINLPTINYLGITFIFKGDVDMHPEKFVSDTIL